MCLQAPNFLITISDSTLCCKERLAFSCHDLQALCLTAVLRRYVKRKAREDFELHKHDQKESVVAKVWASARSELDVVKRQALVYHLYARKQKSVMVSFYLAHELRDLGSECFACC